VTQTPTPVAEGAAAPSDLQDERLIRPVGARENLAAQIKRIRTGDLGALPIVIGLVLISVIFEIITPTFLYGGTLSSILFLYCAPVGVISVGIVLVLLLGQIDLSVGSMSGASAAIFAVVYTTGKLPEWGCIMVSILAGCVVGLFYGFLFVKFAVPSFVVTLAGLLALLGLQLLVLGPTGDVIMPATSFIVQLGQTWYLPWYVAYLLAIIAAGGYALSALLRSRARNRAGLSVPSNFGIYLRAGLLLVGLAALITYLDPPDSPLGGFGLPAQDDGFGVSTAFAFLVVLVVVMNYALTRTKWGRSVFAVGGNVEAARRAGIRVNRVYVSVFVICAALAALGGLMEVGLLGSATLSTGTDNVNLNAIAAAVIGGTSLFGGRGSAWSALLGILVIYAIVTGLDLMQLNSYAQFIVTGFVLLAAVIVDSLSRRSRVAAGRA
jgi:simple sugar transport system permease protein/D-xylose transport system permease protein